MSAAGIERPAASSNTFLLVPIILLFGLLVVSLIRSPSLFTSAGIGSAVIVAAPLILAAFALTSIVTAGRGGVDLSIGPLIGFLNVTLVQLFAADVLTSPIEFFVYAIGVGILYQLIVGLIIVYVRIQPIIVGLSGFLTLAGLNLIILPRPGGLAPDWMGAWGLGESIWSPVLAVLGAALLGWFLFTRTAFYDHLRLMGSDERTAYTAGVNITIVRLGAHVIAGIFAGLAAITFTSLISSGDPTQGSRYTLMAVTAMVLGGTSLAGGRGTIIGSLLGAINIYLITYLLSTFNFGKVQSFITELSYGLILVVALLLTIVLPLIQTRLRGISPLFTFIVLGLIAIGVVLYAKDIPRVPVADAGASAVSLSGNQPQSLSAQSAQSAQSLSSAQSLGSAQSLSSASSAGSLSAGVQPEDKPTGTPVMIALIVIAVILGLLYLLYRHTNFFSVAFVAVLALLLLGYSAYDPRTASDDHAVAQADIPPAIWFVEGPQTDVLGKPGSVLQSPWIYGPAVAVGTILFSSLLILLTVPHVRTRIANTTLGFVVALAAVAAGLIYYESEGLTVGRDSVYFEALGALVVGALLFIVTLPTFQGRVKNISMVMLALISAVAVGATMFAADPSGSAGQGGLESVTEATGAGTEQVGATVGTGEVGELNAVDIPSGFFPLVYWVIAAGGVLFLVMIPGVRRHVVRNVSFEQTLKSFSYLGLFISLSAVLVLGAVFYVSGIPLWKFVVTVIAGLIGARFLWHFLRDLWRKESANVR